MPDPTDDVLELEHNSTPEGESKVADLPNGTDKFHALLEQSMASIGQSGAIAQNNFIGFNKALDYDYIEGKRLVSMEEAMGVREVSATQTPGGPTPRT